MHRVVTGLEWASWGSVPPFVGGSGHSRPKDANLKAGLAYQRKVCRALIGFRQIAETWIEYLDQHGPGFAQPDLVLWQAAGPLSAQSDILLVEIKLSYVPAAVSQLDSLYVPLLQFLLPRGTTIRRAIICKHLSPLALPHHPKPAAECCWQDAPTLDEARMPLITFWDGIGPAPFQSSIGVH